MMGRQTVDQSQLFYLFNLEKRIPERHLLRRINPIVGRILAEFRDGVIPSRTWQAGYEAGANPQCL
jgi:hypothetical protein